MNFKKGFPNGFLIATDDDKYTQEGNLRLSVNDQI